MKFIASLLLIYFTGAMPIFAQPEAKGQPGGPGKIATNLPGYSSSLPKTNSSAWVELYGICVVPPTRMAVLELRTPGQESLTFVVAEGEKAAGIELVAIHEAGPTVTVHYRGSTNELTLVHLSNAGSVSEAERAKDISHQEHHKLRARVERERDALEGHASDSADKKVE
jgi:hypothetical protein